MSDYYILSLRWTRSGEECVTWWGPSNKSYALDLTNAGKYSEKDVRGEPAYYDNRVTTVAIPVDVVDRYALRIVHVDALHHVVTEALGQPAYVVAPWDEALDDNGKPYECKERESRSRHKGPSKLIIRSES